MKQKKPTRKKTSVKGRAWQPSPQLVRMAELLVNPDDRRTKGEKLIEAGLTERTFYRWWADERYINYVNNMLDKCTNAELPTVWKALVRKCTLGDTAAIKLYFELKRMTPEFKHRVAMDQERMELDKKKMELQAAYDAAVLDLRERELKLKEF